MVEKIIIIKIKTEESNERIFNFVKDFCRDNYQDYSVELKGTKFKEEFRINNNQDNKMASAKPENLN